MSLDAGGTSSLDAQLNMQSCDVEEDYCRTASDRFRQQWEQTGQFLPAALQYYGVCGDMTLMRSLMQTRSFHASFGTLLLGALPLAQGNSCSSAGTSDIPLGDVLAGPMAHPEGRSQCTQDALDALEEELGRSWAALQQPSAWAQLMCGVVTVPRWVRAADRNKIKEQLQLATFMGVRAVQVMLPMLFPDEDEDEAENLEDDNKDRAGASPEQRNWQMLAHASDILLAFIQSEPTVRVWVRCDACDVAQRLQFQRLRQLVVYGYEKDAETGAFLRARRITGDNAIEHIRKEAITSLTPMLYFSTALLTLSSEWLGEDVSVFEAPAADFVQRCLMPHCSTGDAAEGSPPSPVGAEEVSADLYRLSTEDSGSDSSTPMLEADVRYRMPADLLPKEAARWGGTYPPYVSFITFVIELLRRRAAPLFSQFFFEHYAMMNYLYYKAVADSPRDAFVAFEDGLQLPLQPLGHQLSSGVYEVFERDASKYRMYREALFLYFRDWANSPVEQRHGVRNKDFVQRLRRGVGEISEPAPFTREEEDELANTAHVVLVGCGRGPIIDEILSAASALGIRVRLFAIEKNGPAAAFTELRWRCDPEWGNLSRAFGHTLHVAVADARKLFEAADNNILPPDFGLCDVVVSELLGSFGDNELSPECLEGFREQLLHIQSYRGIAENSHLVCIPESYTAWAAPIHSTRFEQAVAEAAAKGLTVRPEDCADRHKSIFHSVFVCNVSRGMALAPPQKCWTFSHAWGAGSDRRQAAATPSRAAAAAAAAGGASGFDRRVTLTFNVPPQGRCSGFVGYFSCVLYKSSADSKEEVCISTEAGSRTADMYSWFPCLLAVDPSLPRDLEARPEMRNSKSATTPISLHLQRHTDTDKGRVWYSWHVEYSDGREPVVMNSDGWASCVMLKT